MTDVAPLRRPSALNRLTGGRGDLLAEFFGTFLLIALGDGCVAMAVAGLPGSGRTAGATTFFQGTGDWLLIVWGWAFAVAFAVYVAGGVSGAHLNPAVTVAMAVRRRFPWRKVPGYWLAQLAGAFLGAALVYAVYHPAIGAFEAAAGTPRGEAEATFSIFATAPAPYFAGWFGPLLDQVVGTAVLLVVVLALIDARNKAVSPKMGPLLIGFTVAAIGLSYGANAGYAINPARDFGPRLFAFLAGWGDTAMSGYLWVPIVGPLAGGLVGAVLYDFFIGDVLHARQAAEEKFVG
ncbi:MIP/aquaporin family protein [Amycolatopsis thermophila]|uniref:Glycerol uptake facilitator protein n=1 Tax=Amycolatopsis thermophila TaxID=206084 RepID=A0ABU0EV37_9PSEU|nr:MIP/aquaporin family protein [Amycolatopsis thermophila]MDQ0379175.1 glycerol uptake facilitator protein [Amycolatopsis thermophila]